MTLSYQLFTLYILLHLYVYIIVFNICFCCFATVVPDDIGPHGAHEDHQPRSLTPPTPPAHAEQFPPPPSPHPMRQRAVAQLRPVSVPEIVRAMAGSDPTRQIADFDRHYMPEGQPAAEASSRGTTDAHRAGLKINANGISRSLSEVFAYLTHGTASLEEARKLLSIITNVHHNMKFICFYTLIYIMTFLFIQLDFKPADIKHSSLRTMAKHVRRAMLPGNHEVFQKSFAEGNATALHPPHSLDNI